MMRKVGTKNKKFQNTKSTKSYLLPLTSYLFAKKAQTAMELAVFGAILIFVIGAIVRQALSAGYTQNQQLRAMRQAMSTSYRYSSGLLGGGGANGDASHQTAQIMFVEDRLTAESAKYGAIDRTPFVVSAAATYSRNLFLPVDAGEDYNLPVYDIFINGKHFPFTTARFKTVELARSCANASPCPAQCNLDCSGTSLQFYPGNLSCRYMNPCPPACTDCSAASTQVYPVEWQDNCVTVVTTLSQCISGDCIAACPDFANNCNVSPGPPITDTQQVGCARLYDVVYNHTGYQEWCNDEPSGTPCPVGGDPDYNLTADERFDLNRDGMTDVPAGTDRENFFWQWFLVLGWDAGARLTGATATPNRGEGIVLEPDSCKKNCKSPKHTVVDVDGDLKRERIMINTKEGNVDQRTGVIKQFIVMDMQEGDLDFSRGSSDPGPDPGLTKDTRMYSFVRDSGGDGTYLLIEEGQLYGAGNGQFIRTAQKKDQIDLIERVIQVSNDTGRFCDDSGNPLPQVSGQPNPVEACNNCFSGANIQSTCMDQANRLIFVRSRLVSRHGRKWITPTGADSTVKFTVPGVP